MSKLVLIGLMGFVGLAFAQGSEKLPEPSFNPILVHKAFEHLKQQSLEAKDVKPISSSSDVTSMGQSGFRFASLKFTKNESAQYPYAARIVLINLDSSQESIEYRLTAQGLTELIEHLDHGQGARL